jgi:hypothetical protein
MTDPLSIAASVVGFVGIAGKIIGILDNYIGSVRAAPQEGRSLLTEVTVIQDVLNRLEEFLHGSGDGITEIFANKYVLQLAMDECKCHLTELYKTLGRLPRAKKSVASAVEMIDRWRWPLRKDDYYKTIMALSRLLKIFEFSLSVSSLYVLVEYVRYALSANCYWF